MYLRVKSMAADQESHSGSDSDSETAATSATWITAAVETETSVDSENPSLNAAVEEIGTFRDSANRRSLLLIRTPSPVHFETNIHIESYIYENKFQIFLFNIYNYLLQKWTRKKHILLLGTVVTS